jgi:Domain of unknown function (DUF4349)
MQRTRTSGSARRRTALALTSLVTIAVLGTVAACGTGSHNGKTTGGGSSSSGSVGRDSVGSKAATGGGSAALAPDVAAADSDGSSTAFTTPALLQQRKLVLNSSLEVTVTNVFQTAARVRALATGVDGYVGDERTSGSGRTAASTLQLRVPQDRLGPLTDQVAGLGTVLARTQTSQDVTQQSIDVGSRLATQKASVARIRALLAKATRISDIVSIEGELSQRESALESLEAQLKGLNDAVDLATLTVTLETRGAPAAKPHHASTGFVAGLDRGWDAFSTSLVALLTVLGALLPFAVLLALLGLPALVLWRRRRPLAAPAGQ